MTQTIEQLQAKVAELEVAHAAAELQAKQLIKQAAWNKNIKDSVDRLLEMAGYQVESSSRHQLGLMNFDAIATPISTEALDKYVAEKVKDVQLQDIEQYLLQMAGISTAAIGYWKEGDSILPAYDTPALRDVAKLYANYESRTRQRDLAVEALHYCVKQVPELATVPGIATAIKESEAK